ncbi:MAG: AMP-binding protein [Pseudodesulfovibrio sp.]|uniref:AMP-dependent synthetase and ligase n=3 Tax=Pseudodesulfovibrio aespoeensis TaxID=182210 RepID=E6VY34_PSEA9|nr:MULTISPECIES: AMP-binding protein [Pseudodesulfovibrio]MBU4192733.1 AMP-binding protein [Pseudomonadota bacterium]ADU63848.1 AMP-dependent synthetase and ligase [Pseudodesulfovibrio aespoeensis Aspo-2]MBU4243806.1 AMP-binding protein [Pseudomonadota bacterium]MBU4379979.1 AMP-binding protein [Pseudomonadota bacterium]MBU4514997.1 AMP-binding protein [Pseudomonadota bacterium]
MTKRYKTTLPKLLVRQAGERADKPALREKEWGVWQAVSWRDSLRITAEFACGLDALGLGRGDIVILIGDNRPEWIWAELAIQGLGGVALGLYQDSPADEIEYIFALTECRLVVAEDQEQVDKILSFRGNLPHLEHIVYHDTRGLAAYEESVPGLIDFKAVRRLGRERHADAADRYALWAGSTRETDPALIATTSGTTGRPKLAMLSHANLLSMAHNLGLADPKHPTDEFVSFLPLAWMGEQMMAVASALMFGFCVNFPEEPDTARADSREIGPHLVFSPPRVWESVAAKVRGDIMETTPLKRFLYNRLLPIGYEYADALFEGREPGPWLKFKYFIADQGLFRALRDRLGFSRMRSATTGGAALGPDTFRFFHALGVKLKQIYGQTEIAGISCIHQEGAVDFTSVGAPIPETEVRITDTGEIISRSPAVFLGYYRNEEATRETLRDGWLLSGDAGYFDDNGRLVVIDRLKDVMLLKDGTRFSPQFLENKVKFSPYLREAVILGNGRDCIAAILCIDMDIVGHWAESRMITYTTYQDLAAKDEVYALIRDEVARTNEMLPKETRIRRFCLLYKELDADDGELTRTRKVRRSTIGERYGQLIEALYTDVCVLNLQTEITYQDGRVREMCGTIRIEDMEA